MANRKVDIRLGLRSEEFIAGIERIKQSFRGVGSAFSESIKAGAKAGFNSMKESVKGAKDQIGSTVKAAATLGGALSFGAAAKGALELRSQFQALAFRADIATGKTKDWRAMLERARVEAERTGRTTTELGDAFQNVLGEVGDFDLAEKSMRGVGATATALRTETGLIANVVGALGDKFQVTGDEINESLASVVELTNKGGAQIEDLPGLLHVTGASARAAGLTGADGFKQMIGMFNIAGDALGSTKKGVKAVSALLDGMADPALGKKIKQTFNVDTKDAQGKARAFKDVMADIFAKTGGKREKLANVFTGEQELAVVELSKKFKAGFDTMQGSAKEKTKAGVEAFKNALDEASKTSKTFADVEREAAEQRKNPEVLIRQGLDRLAIAFTKPEMLDAMDKLAQKIPELVDAITNAAEFMMKHPALTAAGVVAGPAVANAAASAGMAGMGALAAGGLKSLKGARAAAAAAKGLSALGGTGATAATTGTAAGAGIVGTAAAGGAALIGVGAALYNAVKLVQEVSHSGKTGGFFEGLSSLAKGPAKAVSGADYDKMMAAQGLLPKAAPSTEKKVEAAVTLEKATAKASKHVEKQASSQERAARAAERLATAIEKAAGVVAGPEKGPFRLPPAGSGAADVPQGR